MKGSWSGKVQKRFLPPGSAGVYAGREVAHTVTIFKLKAVQFLFMVG